MENQLVQVIGRMKTVERHQLLALLAASISEMTILGRSTYDNDNAAQHLRQTYEAIHRLAGHLYDLCNPNEVFTESRSAGIGAQLELLFSSVLSRL